MGTCVLPLPVKLESHYITFKLLVRRKTQPEKIKVIVNFCKQKEEKNPKKINLQAIVIIHHLL